MGMSIDESIEVIKHEKPERPTSLYGAMKKNAFNTAIETMRKYQQLEQEPTTKNDLGVDAVSRQGKVMCKYCEGRAPLMQTNLQSGHNIDVGIYEGKIIAESYYHDAYSEERISKGVKINFCPMCGGKINV